MGSARTAEQSYQTGLKQLYLWLRTQNKMDEILRKIPITDSAFIFQWKSPSGKLNKELRHDCVGDTWMGIMSLRENDEGPVYWCNNCGHTLENGEAMAVRLYEANF